MSGWLRNLYWEARQNRDAEAAAIADKALDGCEQALEACEGMALEAFSRACSTPWEAWEAYVGSDSPADWFETDHSAEAFEAYCLEVWDCAPSVAEAAGELLHQYVVESCGAGEAGE